MNRCRSALFALCLLAGCGGSGGDPSTGWTVATRLDARAGTSTVLGVWSSSAGVPVAAWVHRTPAGQHELVVQAQETGGAWRDAMPRLDLGDNEWQGSHRLAVGGGGTALLAWLEQPVLGGPIMVRVARHDPVVGWSSPESPVPVGGYPGLPLVAVDAQGGLWLVVLDNADDGTRRSWTTRWLAGVGWSSPTPLGPAGHAQPLKLAGDLQGRLYVLSLDLGATVGDAQALTLHRHEPGAGWLGPETVDRHVLIQSITDLVVADGAAWVAWTRNSPIAGTDPLQYRADVFAARCPGAAACEAPAQLNAVGGPSASNPALSVAAGGRALAAWTVSTNGAYQGLQASDFAAAGGWGAPQSLSPAGLLTSSLTRLALWPDGTAMAAFAAVQGRRLVPHASLRAPAGAWRSPRPIADVGDASPDQVELGALAPGIATVAWSQPDGSPGTVGPGVAYATTSRP